MHSNDIEAFLNSLKAKKEIFTSSETDLKYCDNKTQDLLHKLELEKLTYHEKANIAKELETIRRSRRIAKDQLEQLSPIMDFLNNNRRYIDILTQLLGEVRKVEKRHSIRAYTPKAKDLQQ